MERTIYRASACEVCGRDPYFFVKGQPSGKIFFLAPCCGIGRSEPPGGEKQFQLNPFPEFAPEAVEPATLEEIDEAGFNDLIDGEEPCGGEFWRRFTQAQFMGVWESRAADHLQRREYNRALELLNEVIHGHPDELRAYEMRAEAYRGKGEDDLAKKDEARAGDMRMKMQARPMIGFMIRLVIAVSLILAILLAMAAIAKTG